MIFFQSRLRVADGSKTDFRAHFCGSNVGNPSCKVFFQTTYCRFILQTILFQWHGHRNPNNVHMVEIEVEDADVVEDADAVEAEDESEEAHKHELDA